MSTNYYETLEIDRNASNQDISHAFKRLSLKYNPAKSSGNAAYADRFDAICEAWEVLSNPEYKGIFDKYGEYGLKEGIKNQQGQMIGGYTYLGNSEEIFEGYFGDSSNIDGKFDLNGTDVYASLLGDAYGAKNQAPSKKPADITVTLKCTLAEFYNGSLKTVKYSRDKTKPDGRTVQKVEEELQVEVKPGFDSDTCLTFAGMGNDQFTHPRSNLIIKFALDNNSTNYERKGNDLIYTHSIKLSDALTSAPVRF